jgi:hypothetical protein
VHEARTCLGHVTNTNGFSKRFKPASIKRFGEDVSQLIFCGNKNKSYFPGLHKVTNEMMPDVNVLGEYSTGFLEIFIALVLS